MAKYLNHLHLHLIPSRLRNRIKNLQVERERNCISFKIVWEPLGGDEYMRVEIEAYVVMTKNVTKLSF